MMDTSNSISQPKVKIMKLIKCSLQRILEDLAETGQLMQKSLNHEEDFEEEHFDDDPNEIEQIREETETFELLKDKIKQVFYLKFPAQRL